MVAQCIAVSPRGAATAHIAYEMGIPGFRLGSAHSVIICASRDSSKDLLESNSWMAL